MNNLAEKLRSPKRSRYHAVVRQPPRETRDIMFWEDPDALLYILIGGTVLLAGLWLAPRIRRGERERHGTDRKRNAGSKESTGAGKDRKHSDKTIGFYNREARRLAKRYESLPFERVHGEALEWLSQGGRVLDIGAGSGRDAAWFAEKGCEVVAVEPAEGMRRTAASLHPSHAIQWVKGRLPDRILPQKHNDPFNLIWISAVWMHLPKSARAEAFRRIVTLLRPGGQIVITLRHGPIQGDRTVYFTQAGELAILAGKHGLDVLKTFGSDDCWQREEVSWETVVMQSPDDGEGMLSLLRYIILDNTKRKTYKFALLWILVRIADSGVSPLTGVDDDTVALPLGLIALRWIRVYKPLIEQDVPQQPPGMKEDYDFVKKAGFCALRKLPVRSLHPGNRFTGKNAEALSNAMCDASRTIGKGPANYIKNESKKRVFHAKYKAPLPKDRLTLDDEFLRSFGEICIPRQLWQAMGRYAAWIEPILINAWIERVQSYEQKAGGRRRTRDEHIDLLHWN